MNSWISQGTIVSEMEELLGTSDRIAVIYSGKTVGEIQNKSSVRQRCWNWLPVPVTMMRYAGMDHAFMDKIGEYPQAEDCMREIGQRFLAVVSGQEKV